MGASVIYLFLSFCGICYFWSKLANLCKEQSKELPKGQPKESPKGQPKEVPNELCDSVMDDLQNIMMLQEQNNIIVQEQNDRFMQESMQQGLDSVTPWSMGGSDLSQDLAPGGFFDNGLGNFGGFGMF